MAFNNNAELVNKLVRAVASTAPSQWTKVAFYFEFLEDDKIGLRSKCTGRCFGGVDYDVRLDGYDLGGSASTITACEALFHDSLKNGDRWAGTLLVILSDGRFKCRFFYEDTPLLNNDRVAVNERIFAGLNELS